MKHLDDNEIVALASGAVVPSRALLAQQHVDDCSVCRAALVAAVNALGSKTELVESRDRETVIVEARPLTLPAGYTLVEPLGKGGMGEVHAVRDEQLKRTVALKRVRGGTKHSDESTLLVQEAQLAAQLEHPNIVPVHTLGTLPSGEPFYTMKRVAGRTLDQLLVALGRGEEEATPMRLGIVFLQVAQAVAHAHALGVVHGDLKPSNIMLGAHGEVLVTDWGLARVLDESRVQLTTRKEPFGGTPRYMAPELRGGAAPDAKSDVWALGAVLYELLTLTPPGAEPPPPSARAPSRQVPQELEDICLRAMKPDPEQRFASGDELRAAVEDSLSGVRRRENARRLFAEVETHLQGFRALQTEAHAVSGRVLALRAQVKPYDGELQKAGLWREEESLEAVEQRSDEALARCLEGYAQVLGVDPTFEPAAAQLADLHLEQFLAAEARGETRTALLHRRHVERHHRGRHERVLRGGGTVRLDLVAAQTVEAWRLVERGKRIVRGERLPPAGPSFELPMGRYLFVVQQAGMRDAVISVGLGRDGDVSLQPRQFSEAELGPAAVHVPAGPFIYGGDPVALNSAPRQWLTLPDFFIARFPITCAEYLEFLNEAGDAARQHAPRSRPDGGYLWEPDPSGRYVLPKLDADGNPVHAQAAVMGVSFDDAQAYVQWRSRRDGVAWRLPTEHEWEKAARGGDGRVFPWGNGFDPTFCKMALSRPGRPQPEAVGSFPADTSPYGMQDCAGGIREWTDSFFDESHQTRVLRGGAWYFNPHYCRLAFRHGYLPHIVFTNFGFRLARSAP